MLWPIPVDTDSLFLGRAKPSMGMSFVRTRFYLLQDQHFKMSVLFVLSPKLHLYMLEEAKVDHAELQ